MKSSEADGNRILVIGFGNDLRGDDAAGRIVADKIEELGLDGVDVVSVHQPGPELAERISLSRLVIFIDATHPGATPAVLGGHVPRQEDRRGAMPVALDGHVPGRIRLEQSFKASSIGHSMNPSALLSLAESLYGCCPEAFLVGVPGTSFGIGEDVSPETSVAIDEAMRLVKKIVLETGRPTPEVVCHA